MSEVATERKASSVWTAPVLTWVALILLLGVNLAIALLLGGLVRTLANFVVAGVQVALVGLIFMRLDKSSNLVRLTALAGLLWLAFLFVLVGADYFSRP